MKASKKLHNQLFTNLLNVPMRFFNKNPLGRILNRFSKDMGIIDELLPHTSLEAIEVYFFYYNLIILFE